jgi:hypothetical protein
MQAWKFSIKPDCEPHLDPFRKCKDLGLLGLGWAGAYEQEQPADQAQITRVGPG